VPFTRLSESVQTLYAELLDQLRIVDAELAVGAHSGSFVSKTIRGRTYWYLQKSEGATKRQIYLGAESPALLEQVQAGTGTRQLTLVDGKRRRELVSMLAAGGMHRESAAIGTVLRVLSEAGVFRAGGILVGTQAFTCIANLLGVSFEQQSMRTADIDVAHDTTIALGLDVVDPDLLRRLRAAEPAFFAVPGLDSREPSTSFKVRGRDLRVDFLTPARGKGSREPVLLPHLGVAAQPLEGLGYLIEDSIDAVILAGSGIRALVPAPARFAFHKLWVAGQRPASEAPKSRKDVRQAAQLLEVLVEDRPADLEQAWNALTRHKRMQRPIRAAIASLDPTLQERLTSVVAG
jgi:hypothetical protein